MDSAGLISTMRTATSFEATSVHRTGRAGANCSIHAGAFLCRWRRSYALTPAGVGCGTRRVCAQAVETSSTPKGAAGKQLFVEPRWLLSSNHGANLQGTLDGSGAAQENTSRQTKDQKQSIALYYIVINTSREDKSSFNEPNAGILLSLIGEDGNAIMHKIPGMEESKGESSLRFQRAAVDVITVAGPDLGRLTALWIAPEAGDFTLLSPVDIRPIHVRHIPSPAQTQMLILMFLREVNHLARGRKVSCSVSRHQ